jgi:predicted DNA-binding transcriptional regulator AlpA
MPIRPEKVLIRLLDVAAMLSISTDQIMRLVAAGKFCTPVRIGNSVLFEAADIRSYIAERKAAPPPPPPDPNVRRIRGRPRKDGTPAQPRKHPTCQKGAWEFGRYSVYLVAPAME